jgi:hypothetical protein
MTNLKKVLLQTGAVLFLLITVILTVIPTGIYEMIDFSVFRGAADNLLAGRDIYSYYGSAHLPFWLFPWLAWAFIPFHFFTHAAAQVLFTLVSISIGFLVIWKLFSLSNKVSVFTVMFLLGIIVWMGWLVFHVGQVTYFLLGAVGLAIFFASKDKKYLVGCLIPAFLLKPHLFMLFLPALLWVGGRKTFISGTAITLLFLGIATIIQPDWYLRMYTLFRAMGGRVDSDPPFGFTTLTAVLGLDQNYLGTGFLPITLGLVLLSGFVLWKARSLPPVAFLSLAMVLSLACAPRSYSYDMPLLVPGLIWLSDRWSAKTYLLWFAVLAIPLVFLYSSGAYLLVLLVTGLCIHKAWLGWRSPHLVPGGNGKPAT